MNPSESLILYDVYGTVSGVPVFAAQQTLIMTSGVTADSVVNTLHFEETSSATAVPEIITYMAGLYDDLLGTISGSVRQNDHPLKIYDLSLPSPNYPISETLYDFPSAPSGATLPHENAICLSFQATRVSGTPQASRRGRIYVGPVDSGAVGTGGIVLAAYQTFVNTAGANLLAASNAGSTTWVAYSPTLVAAAPVDNGWVDNAFDTQRRRGTKSTLRSTF